jgi:hypothetical protein
VQEPQLSRLLDLGELATGDGWLYLVREWADGPSLLEQLREGPLPAPEATAVAWEVANTLARAHESGVPHGRLHPGNVVLRPGGRVTLTDLQVAAAARGEPAPTVSADLPALGALMYAVTTGYWPPGLPATQLPRVRPLDGGLPTPRQLRAGVPRQLDQVASALLDIADQRGAVRVTSAAAAADLLAGLPRESLAAGPPTEPIALTPAPAAHRARPPRRRWVLPVAAIALLVAAGLGYLISSSGTANRLPPFTTTRGPSKHGSGPSATGLHAVRPVAVRYFNPEGSGGTPTPVGYAVDGKPTTAWYTEYYVGSPFFGHLVHGVGLLFDLGRPISLRAVRVRLTQPGADLQIRSAQAPGADAPSFRLDAHATDAATEVLLRLPTAPAARYWLLWLTKLPPHGGDTYQEGVAEVQLLG